MEIISNQEALVGGNKENYNEKTYETDPYSDSLNSVLPMTEVYLTEDTSCFQLEEEDIKGNETHITCINIDSDSNDTDIEFLGECLKSKDNDEDLIVVQKTQPTLIECKDRNTSKKVETKILDFDNQSKIRKTPPFAYSSKESKYNRESTPICDAIMKEYTKWQKNPTSPSDFSIKDLIKHSKSTAESQLTNEPYTENLVSVLHHKVEECRLQTVTTKNTFLKDSVSQTTLTPLHSTVCDVESKKDVNANSNLFRSSKTQLGLQSSSRKRNLDRSEEYNDPTYLPNNSKKLVSSDDSLNISQNVTVVNKKRGRPFKNAKLVNKPKNKPQVTASNNQCNRATKLQQQAIRNRGRPRKKEIPINDQQSQLTANITDASFQNSSCAQPEVKSVAKHLKLIAEKISNELDNNLSPNIEEETKTLLRATQTLIRLQNQKRLLKNASDQVPSLETIDYNEETNLQKPVNPSTFENSSNRSLNHHTLNQVINHTIDQNLIQDDKEVTQSKQNSTLLETLLQKENLAQHKNSEQSKQNSILLEALLQEKNSEQSKQDSISVDTLLQKQYLVQDKNIDNSFATPVTETTSPAQLSKDKAESNKLPNLKSMIQSQSSSNFRSLDHKHGFIKDFLISYQSVFTSQIVNCVIPKLSEILLLCLDHFVEVVQRTIKANVVTSENLRNQEIQFAKRSFAKVIFLYGNKFFSDFNSIIGQISKTKTDKALVVTLILFISISIFLKTPKYQSRLHCIRKVLICMCKIHKETNQLLWSVLETTDDVYSEIIHLMAKILTYFQKRHLIQIPFSGILTDFLFGFRRSNATITPHTNEQNLIANKQQNVFSNNCVPDEQPSSNRNNPKPKQTGNTVQFGETFQNVQECNSKKMGEKMECILPVFEKNHDFQTSTTLKSVEQIMCNSHYTKCNMSGMTILQTCNSPKDVETVPDNTKRYNFLESSRNSIVFPPEEDKSSSLTEVFPNNHAIGLDSIFFKSYLESARSDSSSEFIDCNFTKHSHSINTSESSSELARPNYSKPLVNSTTNLNLQFNVEQDDSSNFIEFASIQLTPENTVSTDLDSILMLAGEDVEANDPLSF